MDLLPMTIGGPRLPVYIRMMVRRDLLGVLMIERDSFAAPWTEEEFIGAMKNRNVIIWVAESAERVVGFMIYELYRPRVQLLNMAVAADFRRRGIGSQLIDKLAERIEPRFTAPHERNRITLEISERNLGGQIFFRAQGFQATGVLPNFYREDGEDAYAMVRRRLVPVGT